METLYGDNPLTAYTRFPNQDVGRSTFSPFDFIDLLSTKIVSGKSSVGEVLSVNLTLARCQKISIQISIKALENDRVKNYFKNFSKSVNSLDFLINYPRENKMERRVQESIR